jgi:hypothetical protein
VGDDLTYIRRYFEPEDLARLPPSHVDYLRCCDADLLGRGVVLSPETVAETLVTAAEQRRQRALVNRRRHLAAMVGKGL